VDDDDNFHAGDTWYRRAEPEGFPSFYTYIPMHIVEWVSSDIGRMDGTQAGPSPRDVDQADVSAWAQIPWGALRWGFETGETPPDSATYHVDFVPFGTSYGQNDAAEIAAMANDLGKSCSTGKVTEEGRAEALAIMAWFGYAPTGGYIVISPEGCNVPAFALVDDEQRLRGIANPDGYRENLTSTVRRASWSETKQLYR
jgi:hypothetical protein